MTLFRFLVLLALVAFLGCGKKDEGGEAGDSSDATTPSGAVTGQKDDDPNRVLIEINGETLTAGGAERLVDSVLTPLKQQIAPDQISIYRMELSKKVLSDFVFETLMTQEADRLKIAVPEEEAALIRERVSANPPADLGEEEAIERLLGRRKIDLLVTDYMEKKQVTVTDEQIRKFLVENPMATKVPENARARHIMLRANPQDTEEVRQARIKELEIVRQRILDGGSFAEMAAKYSEDARSRNRGGELPPITKSPMQRFPEPIVKAVFELKTNEVSHVIESPAGIHILQVIERDPARDVTPEEVKSQLERRSRLKAVKDLFGEVAAKATINPPEVRDIVLGSISPAPTNAVERTPSPGQ